MRRHLTSIPPTLPDPAAKRPAAPGFIRPTARLLKVDAVTEMPCVACGRYLETGACALAIYHHRDGEFHHAGQLLCPWCGDEPSDHLRIRLISAIRTNLEAALCGLARATTEIKRLGGLNLTIDNAGTAAQTAEHLAIVCTGIILKHGEHWTPTSHPRPAGHKALTAVER